MEVKSRFWRTMVRLGGVVVVVRWRRKAISVSVMG